MDYFKSKILYLLIYLIILPLPLSAQGLRFLGSEKRIDERTTLSLFDNSPHRFKEKTKVDFSLCLYPGSSFGYLMRIKSTGEGKVFNVSFETEKDSVIFRLNEEGHYSIARLALDKGSVRHLHWYDFHLELNASRSLAVLSVAGESTSARYGFGDGSFSLIVDFGLSDHIIDVPSFGVRSIRISDESQSVCFPLDESGNETSVSDSKGRIRGHVKNPSWLISEHKYWKRIASASLESNAVCTYDSVANRFLYFDRDTLITYDVVNGTLLCEEIGKCPMNLVLGMSYWQDGKIICYEPFDSKAAENAPSAVSFDPYEKKWEVLGYGRLRHPVHHHCGFTNTANGRYTIFGGFGDKLYNGSFFSLDESWNWVKDTLCGSSGSAIEPRYFVSAGLDSSRLLIFGGMGNESGEQIVGRDYFYDLHSIELTTGRSELLWKREKEELDQVPVRTLFVDEGRIYTLSYPEFKSESKLQLVSFTLDEGKKMELPDYIPITSDKMLTNASLHFDRNLKILFASVLTYTDDVQSRLEIYRLYWPPVMAESGKDSMRGRRMIRTVMPVAIVLCALAAAGLCFVRIRRRRNEDRAYYRAQTGIGKKYSVREQPGSIFTFGTFRLVSSRGQDISSALSSQQRIILFLLLEYDGEGLSSSRMSKLLWPDKEEIKVKNSRGVAILKLRNTLAMLNGTTIEYEEGRYRLNLGPDCHCDYLDFQKALREKDSDSCLSILSRGRFATGETSPLLDSFREKTDTEAVSILEEEIKTAMDSGEYVRALEICDILRKSDRLNETALQQSVRALIKIKHKEEAYVIYAGFSKEYAEFYGSEYPTPFDRL